VTVVESLRARIESLGGEYRFGTRKTDLVVEKGRVRGVVTASGEVVGTDQVVLAIGHPRATLPALWTRRVHRAEAVLHRVRIEHPQPLIDRARFGEFAGTGCSARRLQAGAPLRRWPRRLFLLHVPGGTVVAATSEPGRVVTNGMSQYSRAERNANSGIVVGISPERDYPAARWPASPSSGIGGTRLCGRRRRLPCAGAARRRFPGGAAVHRAGFGGPAYYRPGSRRRISRSACRVSPWRRSARRCPPSAARSAATTWRRR